MTPPACCHSQPQLPKLYARLAAASMIGVLALWALPVLALEAPKDPLAASDSEFLPVDQAFQLQAFRSAPDVVQLRWDVAEDYYLYRHAFEFAPVAGNPAAVTAEFTPGLAKVDEYFGQVEVYYDQASIRLRLQGLAAGAEELALDVTYQGCADAGLCYAPETRRVSFVADVPEATLTRVRSTRSWAAPPGAPGAAAPAVTPTGVAGGTRWALLLAGAGALLVAVGLVLTWRRKS